MWFERRRLPFTSAVLSTFSAKRNSALGFTFVTCSTNRFYFILFLDFCSFSFVTQPNTLEFTIFLIVELSSMLFDCCCWFAYAYVSLEHFFLCRMNVNACFFISSIDFGLLFFWIETKRLHWKIDWWHHVTNIFYNQTVNENGSEKLDLWQIWKSNSIDDDWNCHLTLIKMIFLYLRKAFAIEWLSSFVQWKNTSEGNRRWQKSLYVVDVTMKNICL